MKKIILLLFLSTLLFNPCFSQISSVYKLLQETSGKQRIDSLLDIVDSLKGETPSVEISDDITSNVVFWGRPYQQKQFGSQTNFVYKNGKGLFIYAIEYYWSKMKKPWAETDFGIEYDKQFTDNAYASIAYERWISSNGGKKNKGSLQNDIEMKFNYDLNILSVEPAVYYMFGSLHVFESDLKINGNYKLFHFLKTGRLFVQPELLISGATSSILRISYASLPAGNFNDGSFRIVDYDLNLPFKFNYKNFEFRLAANYIYPVSILPGEKLKPYIYYTSGFSYSGFLEK